MVSSSSAGVAWFIAIHSFAVVTSLTTLTAGPWFFSSPTETLPYNLMPACRPRVLPRNTARCCSGRVHMSHRTRVYFFPKETFSAILDGVQIVYEYIRKEPRFC